MAPSAFSELPEPWHRRRGRQMEKLTQSFCQRCIALGFCQCYHGLILIWGLDFPIRCINFVTLYKMNGLLIRFTHLLNVVNTLDWKVPLHSKYNVWTGCGVTAFCRRFVRSLWHACVILWGGVKSVCVMTSEWYQALVNPQECSQQIKRCFSQKWITVNSVICFVSNSRFCFYRPRQSDTEQLSMFTECWSVKVTWDVGLHNTLEDMLIFFNFFNLFIFFGSA